MDPHFSLSCIGEGNGNPLQCSCLENPRDSRAWCAAIYGVVQSRTRLKRLSSSSIQSLLCASSQTLNLVTHVHTLRGDVISQTMYLGHMSTVSSVNPYPESVRSDQISRSVMSDSLQPHKSQHARPPCPSPTPGVHPDSRPSSQ